MKLFILLSALCAVALAQINCERYCRGEIMPSNCAPAYPDTWVVHKCGRQCLSNCNNVGVVTCNQRYQCCMTAAAFNNTNKCWNAYNNPI